MLQHTPDAPLDRLFAALADPARRGMVERLGRGSASASELAEPWAMTLSAVMQHLKVLEASGLVASRKSGRVRTFTIRPETLRLAEQWFEERKAAWHRDLDRLEALLEEDPEAPKEHEP